MEWDWEVWTNTFDEYKKAIQRWGEISRGAFNPKNIYVEIDEKVKGVFTVYFTHNGNDLSFRTDSVGWISPLLLHEINELISGTGIHFYGCDTGDQTAFIVALTPAEFDVIRKVRGWEGAKV